MSDHEVLLTIARLITNQYYSSDCPDVWHKDDDCRDMISELELFCKENEPQ